ncbi:MAG: tripartite tricarboxylate transporter TctB family protein [Geminicoccaceae bacterium]
MRERTGQLLFLLALLAIPGYVFFDIATRFAAKGLIGGRAEDNAALFPGLVAGLMVALVAIQLLRTLLAPAGPGGGLLDPAAIWQRYRRAILLFLVFLAYLPGFRWLGFLLATPVFLVAAQLVLGYRHPLGLVLFAGGVTGLVWVTFAKLLNLVLPAGDLFG